MGHRTAGPTACHSSTDATVATPHQATILAAFAGPITAIVSLNSSLNMIQPR